MEVAADEFIAVGQWPSLVVAHEHALVVLAMNLDCRVVASDGDYLLEVEPAVGRKVREELDLY
ncbi:MAG: hypothetical protein ACQKBU_08110, partial [Verrucomicrobiales bacterium]